MSTVLGIDLGTTCARAAVNDSGKPRLLAALPAVVAFPKKGDPTTGEIAHRQAYISPSRSFTAILSSLASTQRREIDGHFYNSVEVAGILLRELRAQAQEAGGVEFRRCVLSVPDRFGWEERRALREAAALAGLHVEGFLVESCAAAIGSGYSGRRLLLCDAGGGSFKAAVLDMGKPDSVRRLATASAGGSGGRSFDSRIAAWLLDEFRKQRGLDLSRDVSAMQRIMEAAEEAKICLSFNNVTTISIPYITAEKDGPLHLENSLSRTLLYEFGARLIRDAATAVGQVLADGDKPDCAVLTGGGAAIPALQEAVCHAAALPCRVPAEAAACAAKGAAIAATEHYLSEDIIMP
ncbi:MAG: Hsp70 family protein [Oscillospiraceae bacterium]|nr:Hsp70 family protein [Oscillospiraceae bacterium]